MESCFTLTLNTSFVIDGEIDLPIIKTLSILKRDMEKTIQAAKGPNNRIRLRARDPAILTESWIIEVDTDEIRVFYGDTLGCIYALLFMSERFLGVTPFWFWNDQNFSKDPYIPVSPGIRRSSPYGIRFRGWFVNDEVLIENWQKEPENLVHWAMVFEALLRCGGNMIIAGTDVNSRKYRSLAAGMGLWITHHHAEPLGAEMFSRIYPGKNPSYTANSDLFDELWEQAVIKQKKYKVIWNLGFRGQGDRPFWADDPGYAGGKQRGQIISGVIRRQYEIVKRHVDNPICCVNLYGEITELYRDGNLSFPPGLIKVWSDNGYGRMVSRRQGNNNPRVHALPAGGDCGPHGIYYHCSFHDLQASNHLTMSPNPAEFIAAELGRALEAGAGEYWIINCGSVKPHVYMLDLIGGLWRTGQIDVEKWRICYAGTYFGAENAKTIAALFSEYASCTAKYGPNEDERAGEQLWHHPVRELLCRWISGDTESCLEELIWLTGDVPFAEQVKKLEAICLEALPKWETFCKNCAALRPLPYSGGGRLFDDSLFLHARLQWSGSAGAAAFCESFRAYASGDTALAFRAADRARSWYEESVKALFEAEHGEWVGYYNGDCLTDIRLTVFCLDALVSYLRIMGDGPDFHKWERDFLTPAAEKKIMLLSSKQRALTNEKLARILASSSG